VLIQRAKHKLAVFGLVGLKQVGIRATSVARKEEDKKTEKQKREVTVKKVKKFLSFLKQQKKYVNLRCRRCLPRTRPAVQSLKTYLYHMPVPVPKQSA